MSEFSISCILPVFNGERYVAEAIESVLAQNVAPTEVLVIDDGSSDGTEAALAPYASRITYLRQENAGPAAARNLGIDRARGDLVAFLDADDLWHERKLERQRSRFAARPELDVSVVHARNFWSPELSRNPALSEDPKLMRPIPAYTAPGIVARRDVFESVGLFDAQARHVHATEWFLRARDCGTVIELLPDVLLHRRLHKTNRSIDLADSSREEFLHLIKRDLDRRRRRASPAAFQAKAPGPRSAPS